MVSDNKRHDESEGEPICCKCSRCGLSQGIVIRLHWDEVLYTIKEAAKLHPGIDVEVWEFSVR